MGLRSCCRPPLGGALSAFSKDASEGSRLLLDGPIYVFKGDYLAAVSLREQAGLFGDITKPRHVAFAELGIAHRKLDSAPRYAGQ